MRIISAQPASTDSPRAPSRMPWWVGLIVAILAGIAIAAGFLTWATYALDWKWTGIGPQPALSGHYPISIGQSSKTLWDWLQLLFVPAVLVALATFLNQAQNTREQRIANTNRKSEQNIAERHLREAALEAYLDRMSHLLLDMRQCLEELRKPILQSIIRTDTVTTIKRLDGVGNGHLIQFLRDSGLMQDDSTVVNLSAADLNDVDLRHVDLSEVNLSKAKLYNAKFNHATMRKTDLSDSVMDGADLSFAFLDGAILTRTHLEKADLHGANLHKAHLRDAHLMGANLRANVEEADLSGAHLDNADLTGATLDNANLSNANLSNATVTDGQLAKAGSCAGMTRPNGSLQP